MNRRDFLKLPIIAAPWIITTPGLLMPIKQLWTPPAPAPAPAPLYDPFQDIDVIVGGRCVVTTTDDRKVMAIIQPGARILLLDLNGKPLEGEVKYHAYNSSGEFKGSVVCDPMGRIAV